MASPADTVILHHYDNSPYSEKLRLALNLKGIPWRSCIHTNVMPRPFLTPDLTGNFRRIPVLQIGADIYADTVGAIPALDRRFPGNSFNPDNSGVLDALYYVTDFKGFFNYLVLSMPWTDKVPCTNKEFATSVSSKEFITDRESMTGNKIPVEAMAAGGPLWRDQLAAHLDSLETSIKGSKTGWIMGTEKPSTADLHYSNSVWFMKTNGTNQDLLAQFPGVLGWLDKLAAAAQANKHADGGKPITPEEAFTIAEAASKAGEFAELASEWKDANGKKKGDVVGVLSDELRGSGKDFFVTGPLVEATYQTIAVRYTTKAGFDVVMHFPRHGYDLIPLQ
ncbi:hypothetical protein DFJ74DRAFT_648675 [Hyaloraphidium curvatum]|nr:hypothetical protein DFJ74DRAFT_648675 [Hyaloraphidium curvatum]